jgi:hypothetical protein
VLRPRPVLTFVLSINSITRYYLNNFLDADKQDAIDLLLGNSMYVFLRTALLLFDPSSSNIPPKQHNRYHSGTKTPSTESREESGNFLTTGFAFVLRALAARC